MLSDLFEHVYIFSQYKYLICLCLKCLNKHNIFSISYCGFKKNKNVCKKYDYILKIFNRYIFDFKSNNN